MGEVAQDGVKNSSNASKKKVIAVVGLCVVACKLPLLLAVLGFGGLGLSASILDVPPIVQTLGISIGVLGMAVATGYLFYRWYRRAEV